MNASVLLAASSLPGRLLELFTLRPYVLLFLAAFLVLAWLELGAARTLVWLASGYLIAFLSELSSIHNGFPYGNYQYVLSKERELWAFGQVPVFDSLSYVFLSYAAWGAVRLSARPLGGTRPADLRPAPGTDARTWLLAGALTMLLDVVIDPVATLGGRWFLGEVHVYPSGGRYFGVPFTNYGGWLLTALAIIGANVLFARWLDRRRARAGQAEPPARKWPYLALGPAGLALGILGFMLGVNGWLAGSAAGSERLRLLALLGASLLLALGLAAALALRLVAWQPAAARGEPDAGFLAGARGWLAGRRPATRVVLLALALAAAATYLALVLIWGGMAA